MEHLTNCRAGSAWGAGPGCAGVGLGRLLPHPSFRQPTLLPLRFREITRNTRFPAKLHETWDSPRNYTKHEIPREITRNMRFSAKLHETRDSQPNYTKHEIPLAKLHETWDSPRNYTKHEIPLAKEIIRNTRFPANLHETWDSPQNYTKHEISLAKLNKTRDSPRNYMKHKIPRANYTKHEIPRAKLHQTQEAYGVMQYQFRKTMNGKCRGKSACISQEFDYYRILFCGDAEKGTGSFANLFSPDWQIFRYAKCNPPSPTPPDKPIKIHGNFVHTLCVRYMVAPHPHWIICGFSPAVLLIRTGITQSSSHIGPNHSSLIFVSAKRVMCLRYKLTLSHLAVAQLPPPPSPPPPPSVFQG